MNRRDKKKIIVLAMMLLFSTVTALWCVDVSMAAYNSGGMISNGWFSSAPLQMYHAGIYVVVISAASSFLVIISLVV